MWRPPQRNVVLCGPDEQLLMGVAREVARRMRRTVLDFGHELRRQNRLDLRHFLPFAQNLRDVDSAERLLNEMSYRRNSVIVLNDEALEVPGWQRLLRDFALLAHIGIPLQELSEQPQPVAHGQAYGAEATEAGRGAMRSALASGDARSGCHIEFDSTACSAERIARVILHCFYT